jgi:hypothetical protein
MQTSMLEMLGLPEDSLTPGNLENKVDLSTAGSRFVAGGDMRYRLGAAGGTLAEFIDALGNYNLWSLGQDHLPVFQYWWTRRGTTRR